MIMTRLGRHRVLVDHYFRGRRVMALWTDFSVYQRVNGSCFVNDLARKRHTITRREDGSFYLRSDYDGHTTR
jgi:hypothetical protein